MAVFQAAVGQIFNAAEVSVLVRKRVETIQPVLAALVAEGALNGDADLYCLLPERMGKRKSAKPFGHPNSGPAQ